MRWVGLGWVGMGKRRWTSLSFPTFQILSLTLKKHFVNLPRLDVIFYLFNLRTSPSTPPFLLLPALYFQALTLCINHCPLGWAIHQLSAVSYLYTVYIAIVFSLVPVLVFTENAKYLSYSGMPLCFQTFKSVNLCQFCSNVKNTLSCFLLK